MYQQDHCETSQLSSRSGGRGRRKSIAVNLILAGFAVYTARIIINPPSIAPLQGGERPELREEVLDGDQEDQFLQGAGLSHLAEDAKYDTKELDVPTWLVEVGLRSRGHRIDAWLKAAIASATTSNFFHNLYSDARQFAPYAIADLVKAEVMSMFEDTYGILVYDPKSDEFLLLYNDQMHKWKSSCTKLASSFATFTSMLRQSFPERFQGPESPELGKFIVYWLEGVDFELLVKFCLVLMPSLS